MKLRSWHLETRKLSDLKAHMRNPRYLSKKEAKQLKKSLSKFGMIDKPVISHDNEIIGGHQRIALLDDMGIDEVECWVSDDETPLTSLEIDELNIRLNKNQGDWDWDILANEWDENALIEWGFEESDFEEKASKKNKSQIIIEVTDEHIYDELAQKIYEVQILYTDGTQLKLKK